MSIPSNLKRCNFEIFKSNVCHDLKRRGDINFMIDVLEEDEITKYFEYGWYAESLYLLAMLDYPSKLNEIPLCDKYDSLRKACFKEPLYPESIRALAFVMNDDEILNKALKEAIPEFIRFNIVEGDVRNVV